MGSNKFENFVFSAITCILMVFIMTWYNGILDEGIHRINIFKTLIMFFPICIVAFLIDWFIISKLVKSFIGKFLRKNDPVIKKILIMTFFMVFGMASCMSFISTIAHGYYGNHFLFHYGKMWIRNFPFALLLNLLIVGPAARAIFLKIFPPKLS